MKKRDITYLTDVYLLTCVVQPGHKETILKAARDVGAISGAISHTARGVGARERLGVWGVAVEAGRDIISILVSSEQRDLVYDTLYRAAGLDDPLAVLRVDHSLARRYIVRCALLGTSFQVSFFLLFV